MTASLVALLLAQNFFTWTDKNGVDHFTDDRSTIPKGAKVKQTEGEELDTIEVDHPAAPAARPIVAPQENVAEARKREDEWRQAFRTARNRVTDLEAKVESERKQVEEVNGLPVTGRLSCRTTSVYGVPGSGVATPGCYPTRAGGGDRQHLEQNRRELQRAKDELSDLQRRAANDAVPLEWRQ